MDEPFPVRLLARGRDEGIKTERLRVLDILAAVGVSHRDGTARDALIEIERRVYDVDTMP